MGLSWFVHAFPSMHGWLPAHHPPRPCYGYPEVGINVRAVAGLWGAHCVAGGRCGREGQAFHGGWVAWQMVDGGWWIMDVQRFRDVGQI